MEVVQVDGAELFTEAVGTGPPALVLHGGLGIDHQPYRGLDPLADDLRLVYYDHRGNGRSTGDVEAATMRQWADDAAALARHVGGDDGAILIGHSFGGFIAQETAIAHPAAVRALVLLTTTPGQLGEGEVPPSGGPPPPEEFRELLSSKLETDDDLARTWQGILGVYLHDAPTTVLDEAMATVVYRVAAMQRGFAELAQWSAVDRLPAVRAPTLVVAGRHDAITSWPQAERIARQLPDAEVIVLEHSAHFPWLEEPDAFFDALRAWFRRRDLIASA